MPPKDLGSLRFAASGGDDSSPQAWVPLRTWQVPAEFHKFLRLEVCDETQGYPAFEAFMGLRVQNSGASASYRAPCTRCQVRPDGSAHHGYPRHAHSNWGRRVEINLHFLLIFYKFYDTIQSSFSLGPETPLAVSSCFVPGCRTLRTGSATVPWIDIGRRSGHGENLSF